MRESQRYQHSAKDSHQRYWDLSMIGHHCTFIHHAQDVIQTESSTPVW